MIYSLPDPYGVHYGMINASDLVLVDEDGSPVMKTNSKVNKAGFMIHAALHKARPDVNAACHTHSRYGRVWSAFGKPIEMLNQGNASHGSYPMLKSADDMDRFVPDSCYFHNDLSVYEDFGGVVLGADEGNAIANALGPTNMDLILQNHG